MSTKIIVRRSKPRRFRPKPKKIDISNGNISPDMNLTNDMSLIVNHIIDMDQWQDISQRCVLMSVLNALRKKSLRYVSDLKDYLTDETAEYNFWSSLCNLYQRQEFPHIIQALVLTFNKL